MDRIENGILSPDRLQGLLEAGGPVMIVLLIMSVLGMTVVLLKLWQFHRVRLGDFQSIHVALRQWRQDDVDSAFENLRASRNPAARVVEVAMILSTRDHDDDALIREEVTRVAAIQLASMRAYLKVLEVIATLSPLLGLLGTVLGMIKAFQSLEDAGAAVNPALLSGGIWEALLTTAAGLIIAVPAVMTLSWLERRVERFKLAMEDAMTRVFTSTLMLDPEAAGAGEIIGGGAPQTARAGRENRQSADQTGSGEPAKTVLVVS